MNKGLSKTAFNTFLCQSTLLWEEKKEMSRVHFKFLCPILGGS